MKTMLRPSQRMALKEDLQLAEEKLTNPEMAPYLQHKAEAQRQHRKLRKVLEESGPEPFKTPQDKDQAAIRARELRDDILIGMPTQEEMRRNPPGAVSKHMRWEKGNKAKILEWKQLVQRLDPDSDDRDLANLERYRPERPFAYTSEAQIAGHHAMSPTAKANWPETLGANVNSALAQVEKARETGGEETAIVPEMDPPKKGKRR